MAREAVNFFRWEAEGPGYLTESKPFLETYVRTDHGDPLLPVAAKDIVNDLVAPFPIKVQVKIGQIRPQPVKESFKEKVGL